MDDKFLRNIAVAKNFNSIPTPFDQLGIAQSDLIDFSTVLENLLQGADIDARPIIAEGGIVEALLGETAVDRHLTAFEAMADGATGTGFLTFVAFATGFTVA